MIGKLLGHRELRSTAIYTHLDNRDVLRAAVELDLAINGSSQFAPGPN